MDYRTPFIVTKVIIAQKNKEQPGSLDNDKKLYKNTFTYFGHTLPIIDTRQLSQEEINAIALKNDTYDPEFDFDYELSDEDIYNMTAQSWTIEYKGQLEQQLRKAAQNLLTIIANDIKDTTLPENYIDKGTVPAGYPYYSESTLVEKNEEYTVMRFTYGTRAGAICVMPTKGNEGKILCL